MSKNIIPSKKIHSIEDARKLAKKRVPKLMFDFVDGASGDEKLCGQDPYNIIGISNIYIYIYILECVYI